MEADQEPRGNIDMRFWQQQYIIMQAGPEIT
jgi:hypothetical protein